jgi:hypothetical protein
MPTSVDQLQELASQQYKWGFETAIEADTIPKGLSEDVVRLISKLKNEPEFMTNWRLEAFRKWQTMKEPSWPHVHYPPINYQDIIYYAAPKAKALPKSLDEVDPELLNRKAPYSVPPTRLHHYERSWDHDRPRSVLRRFAARQEAHPQRSEFSQVYRQPWITRSGR